MADWEAALKAIGGAAAIGALIDLAMYTTEKKKLQNSLETWWLRFTDLKWSNFGRKEAELAIQYLDSWAGPRLWSWKRWRFAAAVTVLAYAFVVIWTALRWQYPYSDPYPLFDFRTISTLLFLSALPATIALALSLTVTRLIATKSKDWCINGLSNAYIFAALLIVHWLLLCYWSVVVFVMEMVPLALIFDLLGPIWSMKPSDVSLIELIQSQFTDHLPPLSWGWLPLPDWSILFDWHFPGDVLSDFVLDAFKVVMDIIANGLRILFALVFLSSFVFRPLIQEPVSRLWYGAMNSGKPFFTMVFGAIGTLIAVGQALAK